MSSNRWELEPKSLRAVCDPDTWDSKPPWTSAP